MTKYVTLKDVAQKAGTTASTVSYVLSGTTDRYISKATREKVLDAVKELNYIKSNGAASLKGKDTKLIGIVVPQFENQFFTRIIVSSEKEVMEQGYDLMICDSLDNPEREKESITRMLRQRISGLIISPTASGYENTETVRNLGLPMVVVDRPLETHDSYSWVTTDNYSCGKVGAQYLLEMGHKNIAFIGWKTPINNLGQRKQAVLDVYNGKGNVFVEEVAFNDESGFAATDRVLKAHPEITAVFYGFNMQAKGGISALRRMNKKIGEDISVLLIGSPEWVSAGDNDFAHVDMCDYELGSKAAELLLRKISGEDVPEKIIQPCTLVKGASVLQIA